MSTQKRIEKLEAQRATVIEQLLTYRNMLRGTLGRTFRKCGKPTCWCANDRGHPYLRITWTEEAQSRTKAIPEDDFEWVREMTSNYRKFQKLRRDARRLDAKLATLLDKLQNETVKNTRRKRQYF